ncbi:arabinan endo-1,5-alpha-L-arabinosidase [Draconibacterium halophilum]|uniref:Arabinan endo-1,5-alpha-L-arabinosidase n=1 Tax=Draconibacterium halophilum TaxID=2706887 RepID=A0A6C0RAT7_9BACT|nr:arabinan endo-1,5-alpha-L-arabinosidase [Draconibacterium halophilum]QIA06573.1 arabinan endo-1,5-alpha-L-arabinosidase [Draconibacterium halophilum]
MKQIITLLAIILVLSGKVLAQNIVVHDPVMIKENDTYYLFCTGWGVSVWSSTDMVNWTEEKPVFKDTPKWALEAVEGFKGHIWAPDIAFLNDQYYLYYSVSSFGKNTSCIGLATNKTLDPNDPDFEWIDHGKVIQSFPGKTNWNAIDPNLIVDKDGTPYMSFGSFWDGLKLVKLTPDAKTVAENLNDIPTIASRKSSSYEPNPTSVDDNPVDAGANAIEAPFIFKKGDYYYLFASIDYCCKGVESTYKMIVGRSKEIPGPYLDKEGKDMATGGGNIILQGNKNWHGVGHNSAYTFNGKDYLVYHAYDANDNGAPKLQIKELEWDSNDWPAVKETN